MDLPGEAMVFSYELYDLYYKIKFLPLGLRVFGAISKFAIPFHPAKVYPSHDGTTSKYEAVYEQNGGQD
jgi:hypothetical protein